jgi:tetratricopeptide (TPR) repeat protein
VWAALVATLALAQQPDLAVTEKAYEAELRARPTAEAWEKLGLARHLQNKFSSAIEAFENAVRLDPKLWNAHLFLGIGYYRSNRFDQALQSLNRADRLAPSSHPGRDEIDYWLGATRIAARQPLAGLAGLEKLLVRKPNHPDALPLVVRTYADLSAELWNNVAEHHFDTAPGQMVHGHALESEDNRAGAIEAFQRARSLAPRRRGTGLAIARLLLAEGKLEEAVAALVIERGPEADYLRGLIEIARGRYNDALGPLESASRWPRRAPEAALALAQVYLALNRRTDAITAAQRALELDPGSPAARELLETALSARF